MDDQRLIYWLRLLTIDGISSAQAQALLAKVGLPEEIFNARLSTLREVVGEQLALKLRSGLTHEKELLVESTLHWLRETPKASFVALVFFNEWFRSNSIFCSWGLVSSCERNGVACW